MADNGDPLGRFSHDKQMLARRYRVGGRTIQNWVSRKLIPYLRVGGILRFDPIAVDKALGRFTIKEAPLEPTKRRKPSERKSAISKPTHPFS